MSGPRGIAILGSTGSIGRSTLERDRAASRSDFASRCWAPTAAGRPSSSRRASSTPDTVVLVDQPGGGAGARGAARMPARPRGWRAATEALAAAGDRRQCRDGDGGDCRRRRLAADAGRRARRQARAARQQGSAGHGRPAADGRGAPREAPRLIPIDSEHNAIFQCMPGGYLPGDAARRRDARDLDRLRRSVPHAPRWRASRASRPMRPALIRSGRWAARFRWTRRRS